MSLFGQELRDLQGRARELEGAIDRYRASKALSQRRARGRISRSASEGKTVLRSCVRRHTKYLLKVANKNGGPLADSTIDESVAEPRLDRLKIDLNIPGVTPWTFRTSTLFEADFIREYRLGSFPELLGQPEPGEVAQAFIDYALHLKSTWREQNHHNTSNVPQISRKMRVRRHNRQRELYARRRKLLCVNQVPSSAIDILSQLGMEGMSTDESEGDVKQRRTRRFLIKKLPWRDPRLTEWLHQIDGLSDAPSKTTGNRSNKCTPRMPSALVSDSRPVPKMLPRSFYSLAWLSQHTRHEVVDQDVVLPMIALPLLERRDLSLSN